MKTTEEILALQRPILLFDGVCNLCSNSVQWVIEFDTNQHFLFASLQSEIGQQLLAHFQLSQTEFNSLVLIHEGRVFTHSEGALRMVKIIGKGWQLLYYVGMLFPRFLRDAVYNMVARNRYRWFGQQESCWLPTPALKARFL